jgi:hypothetical protein
MRFAFIGVIAPWCAISVVLGDPIKATYRAALTPLIDQQIQEHDDHWLALYKDLHTNPELSLREQESAAKVAARLKAAGFEVTAGVGGHGVVGVLANGPGPTVLIRGDMDALPIVEETGLPYQSKVKVELDEGAHVGECPIKAVLDPYNPTGSTAYVNFNTSKKDRWQTVARRCHINWVILDSDWEAEFCRVAEAHPKVRAYAKNHNLGLEVPYKYGSESRKYLPDFIVLVDDGHPPRADGSPDLLHLVVEIKGYRREDAKEKKATMDTCWVLGVDNLGSYGRWAFAEFCDVYEMEADFEDKVEEHFNRMIESISAARQGTIA